MTDDNKQSIESKNIIKWFLFIVIISFIALISYFIFTPVPLSMLDDLNNELLCREIIGKLHKWRCISSVRLSSLEEPLNLRNIILGIAGAVTLVFTGWRTYIADEHLNLEYQQRESEIRQNEIESDRRLSERFDAAVDVLSKDLNRRSFPAHLGAISSLRALAIDSPENTQRCLDIICSCNQWMEEYLDEFVKGGSSNPYSSRLLKESNRIIKQDSQYNADEITLLHERRSQESLAAISNIVAKISTNNPEQLKRLKFYNKMLCGISLSNLKLDGIDFRNTYLVAADLSDISLNKAKLEHAQLQGASLDKVNLEGASLDDANLQKASLNKANLQGASLDKTNLEGASLVDTNLQKVSLDKANLQKASLRDSNLQEASLDDANLQKVSLYKVNLKEASLNGANIRGAFLDRVNLQRASLGHAELQGVFLEAANLEGAFLTHANLQGASLDDSNLQGTSLDGTNLHGASLHRAHLQGASLRKAHLQGASLWRTNLQGALLISTQLQGASLDDADLSYTIFLDCNLYGTTLKNIKSENIIFNNIEDVGYIKDKQERIKWLESMCQYMEPEFAGPFRRKIKMAWQEMDNLQEPDGLEIIEENSIVSKDSQNVYDISDKHLANLQEILQKLVNERGINFLYSMRNSLLSFSQRLKKYIDPAAAKAWKENASIDRNTNLVNKLQVLIEQLIESNERQQNKQSNKLE